MQLVAGVALPRNSGGSNPVPGSAVTPHEFWVHGETPGFGLSRLPIGHVALLLSGAVKGFAFAFGGLTTPAWGAGVVRLLTISTPHKATTALGNG